MQMSIECASDRSRSNNTPHSNSLEEKQNQGTRLRCMSESTGHTHIDTLVVQLTVIDLLRCERAEITIELFRCAKITIIVLKHHTTSHTTT
jgi:hypothetical protein